MSHTTIIIHTNSGHAPTATASASDTTEEAAQVNAQITLTVPHSWTKEHTAQKVKQLFTDLEKMCGRERT